MAIQDFKPLFYDCFKRNGLEKFCTDKIAEDFEIFTEHLLEVNAHTNLTAIRELSDIIAKHYADCLLAEQYFPSRAKVIDIGCGGGFPSVPLAIVRKDLQITAIDSTAKKIAFVSDAIQNQRLTNLTALCDRAESPVMAKYKGKYDVGTCRAVSKLSVVAELILPYVKIGGLFIALKGASGEDEVHDAKSAVAKLGGEIESIQSLELSTNAGIEQRKIILIRKIRETPAQFPRQYSAILKKQL